MYIKGKNRGGPAPLPPHPKKHHKPYRARHLSLFAAGVAAVVFSVFAAGYLIGQARTELIYTPPVQPQSPSPTKSTFGEVDSSLGFYFAYDSSVFSASGQTTGGQNISGVKLKQNLAISNAFLSPKSSAVNGQDVLSKFTLHVDSGSSAFDTYQYRSGISDRNKALANYFAPVNDQNFTIKQVSQTTESINGLKLQRTVYEQTPNFGASKPIFAVVWSGFYKNNPVKIELQNLLSGSQIPSIYGQVFSSLRFGSLPKSGVLSDSTKGKSFDINKISPAVVKIYHFVCGTLVINGISYGHDACDGGTGSGFFVSSDGYIATSGHVVVLNAADILVNQLLNNPALLEQFTAAAGLSAAQSARSDVVAALLAKIYDLPSTKLRLDNRREITFAALGDQPLSDNSQDQVNKDFSLPDSDYIKKADILAVDYQPKDLLVIEQNTQQGFSASDMALLKVNAQNTPFISLADSSTIEQDAPISLIGFPADADNQLTDNQVISPSITTGTISSIRQANGSSSLLFQTDADASEGNSGGPAISQAGQVFGLVTYRFKSDNQSDAAKSYIRDIADFSRLVDSKNISLNQKSPTQTAWEAGLDLFSSQRYSKALVKFRQVEKLYPAQRLAGNYIEQAEQAIREGKDKKDPPYGVMAAGGIGLIGAIAIFAASRMIINHRRAHLAYKAANRSDNIFSPQ